MISILVPVLLCIFIGPGVGQLYNGEGKKAFVLMGLSLVLVLGFSECFRRAAVPFVSSVDALNDVAALRALPEQIIRSVIENHRGTFFTYSVLITAIWAYGIVDAYLGALRKKKRALDVQKEPKE